MGYLHLSKRVFSPFKKKLLTISSFMHYMYLELSLKNSKPQLMIMKKVILPVILMLISITATSQNPLLLKDVYPGATGSGIQQIVKTTGYTFFNAEDDDPDPDRGLYRTDGTPGGTIKLNLTYLPDPPPSPNNYVSTKAEKLIAIGNKIIFAGDNFPNYGEIWASDGTQAGTIAIERFQPTTPNRLPVVEIAKYGTNALYSVINNSNHALLKKTDGTLAGTSIVFDFNTIFASAPEVVFFKELNGIIYFIVYDSGGTGYDYLWRSDGSTAGTYELKDFGATQYVASNIMVAGNNLYLMIVTPGTGNVLWKSDGTAAGTTAVKTIGTTGNNNYPHNVAVGSTMYFAGLDGNGKELWKTDGTTAGTVMVADINTGAANSNPANLTLLNGNIYFSAADTGGNKLWKYDGSNLTSLKSISCSSNGNGNSLFAVSNNTILFNGSTALTGAELWITDGTAANTVQVADINPGAANSSPSFLTPGNPVYFSANNGVNGVEIFKYENNGDVLAGPNRFYVNDNSLSGDVFTSAFGNNANNGSKAYPFATIDYALGIAQAGDTIYVDAGTYDLAGATLSLSKSVVFLGTNYLVSPNDPANKLLFNTARHSESIISNGKFSIASNESSFEGFTMDMGNRTAVELINTAVTNNDFGNFRFAKNILKITNTTANLNQFSITGKFVSSPNMPQTSGYTLSDNRFEKSGSATGNTLNFNYVKIISVTDNSFVVTGTTFRTQQAVNLGVSGLVDAVVFSNNTVSEASTAFGGNRIGGAVISANKMQNLGNAFANTNNMPESSNIEFSNNEMGNDLGTPFMLYNRNGASLPGTSNMLKVENNIITGVSQGSVNQLFGTMNFTVNNSVLNPTIIIRGNKINYGGDFSSVPSQFFRPVTVRGNVGNTTIENNDLILSNSGGLGAFVPSNPLPVNPAITIGTDNGTAAYMTPAAVINILNNKIQGYKQSVVFYDVSAAGHDAFTGYGNIPAGAVVNINNNSFTADSISINNGTNSQTVNATCNWYGTAAAQSVISKITSSTVSYTPWLVSGTDVSAVTGFQPVGGSCNGTPVVAVGTQVNNVTCNGADNGSVNVTISGGSTPYSFAWSKDNVAGFSTLEDISGLAPGIYQLVVTDANGSTATVSAEITQPDILIASATGTNVNCFGGSNGTAAVNASGGTAPYTYLWSNAATTNSISGLAAGNYTVTVTDANGCARTASYTVTQPTALTASAIGTNINCFEGSNGSATVTATGGTTPYTYLWNNAATTNSISGLAAGIYTVTVTDANGCATTASYTVTQPTSLIVVMSGTNASCFGGSNGSATVIATGGAAIYSYLWSNGGTTNSINGLAAGLYTVTVTDANGCATTVSYTVTQPTALTASAIGTNVNCFEGSNGSATVTATGGTTPYTYLWNNAATTNSISGLAAGNYTVTVTDANGCARTASYTVTQPTALTASAIGTNVNCFEGSNGSATVIATGGTAPYSYLWSNGATTNSISGLAARNYTVTVTDANGCARTASYTVTQPTALTATAIGTNVNCFGGSNGSATVIATGGTATYSYLWSNGSTTNSITGLAGGVYSVTVTDANECTTTVSYTVTQPAALTVVMSGTNVSCFGNSNGTATVNATGGTAPYSYLWSNGSTTNSITGLVAGNYSVTVTDANGCTTTGGYLVTQPTVLTVVMSGTNANCSGSATATPSGGTSPYTYSWSNGATTQTISGVPNGTYTVIVTDAKNCTVSGTRNVNGNSSINPTASVINVTCFGQSNGSITVTGAGGVAPHTYNINGGAFQSNNVFTGLSAAVYVIGAKDANGCVDFITKTVSRPAAIVITLNSIQNLCFGGGNGSISINVTGGSGGNIYSWTGAGGFTSTSKNINNLTTAGNYTVTVTDNNGCAKQFTATLLVAAQIIVNAQLTNLTCKGAGNGAISIVVSGGSGSGFTFSWSGPGGFNAASQNLSNLAAGRYDLTVTDATGCTTQKSYTLTEPSAVNLSTSRTNATGCNSLGKIIATATGGTSPYQFKLNNGSYQSSGSFTGLYAGSYVVTAKDANGCTDIITVSITDNGNDDYEKNDSKSKAAAIVIGSTVNARIAAGSDPADWFKFTTPSGAGNYILSLSHPSASFTFNMYAAGNNTPALVPVATTATTKEYTLAGSTTYYISVTGGLSYICYDMMIAPPTSFSGTITTNQTPVEIKSGIKNGTTSPAQPEVYRLSATAFPNPHQGAFNLRIISPEAGNARIELFTVNGQRLQEKTVLLQKSKSNIVPFIVSQHGIIFYRIVVGNNIISGKITGIE